MSTFTSRWDQLSDKQILHQLQLESFEYFNHHVNFANGLVWDNSRKDAPSSIACVGLALSALPVAVERSFLSRSEAVRRTRGTLRFFARSEQSSRQLATGRKGFYYHFLNPATGKRTWGCELSTMDTAILLAGALVAATYFDRDNEREREIRDLGTALYLRTDWNWALRGTAISQGWKPGRGFLRYRWQGYSEALLLYVLALGSPTHPVPQSAYQAFTSRYEWRRILGQSFLYAGPLFIHQMPQIWLDLRGLQDSFMRRKKSDYYKNSRKATLVQQSYAQENPRKFRHYGKYCWGVTASDGPGNMTLRIDGVKRRFYDYLARGVAYGPDDGTIAPWGAVASLPFAPDVVLPTIRHFDGMKLRDNKPYGFEASFNPTFPVKGSLNGWVARYHFGLNQGPIVLMIENYRSGLIWKLMRKCPYVENGLRRAGFRGGWLGKD
jgi:hypothetical protein